MAKELNSHSLNNYGIIVVEISLELRNRWDCLSLSLTLLTIKIVEIKIIEIINRSPTVTPLSLKFIGLINLYQL